MTGNDGHLQIGALLFQGIDQIDLTGPFEVLSRVPNSTFRIFAASKEAVKDTQGFVLTPDDTFESAPQLDVLHVPGGPGQEKIMENDAVIDFIKKQAAHAEIVFSVCTGALLLGAAGLLQGKRATTHWASIELLPLFGAQVVQQRVVVDGKFVFAAGITSGIDGALVVAALLRGDAVAEAIQLALEYAPEPPFNSGTPDTAPASVLESVRAGGAELFQRRKATALKFAKKFGITDSAR